MNAPRRRVLQSIAGAATVGVTSLAGCQSFERTAQLLVAENETDSAQTVSVVVLRTAAGMANTSATTATTADATATTTDATATTGTSERFVVEFEYELGPGGRMEEAQVLPQNDTFDVVATVPDVGTGRGGYEDTESVRVTIRSDDVSVQSFTPN